MAKKGRSQKPIVTILIIVISIAIPVIVTLLYIKPDNNVEKVDWVYILPHLNAVINGLTLLILITG